MSAPPRTEGEWEDALWYLGATLALRSELPARHWVDDAKRNWSIGRTAREKEEASHAHPAAPAAAEGAAEPVHRV